MPCNTLGYIMAPVCFFDFFTDVHPFTYILTLLLFPGYRKTDDPGRLVLDVGNTHLATYAYQPTDQPATSTHPLQTIIYTPPVTPDNHTNQHCYLLSLSSGLHSFTHNLPAMEYYQSGAHSKSRKDDQLTVSSPSLIPHQSRPPSCIPHAFHPINYLNCTQTEKTFFVSSIYPTCLLAEVPLFDRYPLPDNLVADTTVGCRL